MVHFNKKAILECIKSCMLFEHASKYIGYIVDKTYNSEGNHKSGCFLADGLVLAAFNKHQMNISSDK